jgi:hypothetical protein
MVAATKAVEAVVGAAADGDGAGTDGAMAETMAGAPRCRKVAQRSCTWRLPACVVSEPQLRDRDAKLALSKLANHKQFTKFETRRANSARLFFSEWHSSDIQCRKR